MLRLIPRLQDLDFDGSPYKVPAGFCSLFVGVHQSRSSEAENWRDAQNHWEVLVGKVFETDAISPNADGHDALLRAVTVAAQLLMRIAVDGRCPICPA